MQILHDLTNTASKKQTSAVRAVVALMPISLLCGCEGIQSALAPRGPHAQVIADISWVMFAGATAILLLVMVLALYAVFRKTDQRRAPSANALIIAGGIALPVITLSSLLIYTVHAMGELRAQPATGIPQIEVIGNRWWWDVHYRAADGRTVASANEIRIPAGQPVAIALRTNDVIHSFWVPNLAGKLDLIPGRTNRITVQANAPGTFRGQCAEYCGAQHARMAFIVIAEPPQQHAAWLQRQLTSAPAATDAVQLRGRKAFIANDCARCHTVRGVATATERGPDLTHVGSRRFIAAGTLDNNHDNLVAFIARSQSIKPRNGMPSFGHLPQDDLHAIATYLQSLE